MKKKTNNEEKMKKKIKEQERVIDVLSNKKVVRGLISALEDVKKGNYIVLTN